MTPDELVVDPTKTEQTSKNLFAPLEADALRVLQQTMLLSGDKKLRVAVAQDVLDRGGHGKLPDSRPTTPIIITNSQVAIMSNVAEEVENALANEGE